MLSEFENVKMRYAIPLFFFFPLLFIMLIERLIPGVTESKFNSVFNGSYIVLILILWKLSVQTKTTLRKNISDLFSMELLKDLSVIFFAQLLFSMSTANLSTAIAYWFNPTWTNDLNAMNAISFSSTADLIFMVIGTSLLVPILEEYVFRGVMFSRLTHKFNLIIGIVISSVIFGVLHELDALGATVFALFCCFLYLKYQNILVPILLHILNNLLACIPILLAPEMYATVEPINQELANTFFKDGLILLPVSVVFIYWGYRRLKNTNGGNNKHQIAYKRAM
ncbi:MAG: lysostaphin resistance A-like protein [Turicibacter sp.]